MTLGQRIQELRKKANLSQNDLVSKIEVSYPQMSRYEIKGVQPPADVLKRLADVFGVSIDYIVNGTLQGKAEGTLSDTELLQQFKEVELMNDSDKSTIKELINAFIAKRKIQSIL
ncbi:helix-turn-helix transcriptional regulator [Tenacibaculum sp. 190524A02b]|uniref:HTH cro/C1-type domain-containing protein n=1 Tax=Tenacibaculum vairaonense TaxID=3137860 RepID=A0ABP1F9B8_9FLAO